jgi:hypothetical protein
MALPLLAIAGAMEVVGGAADGARGRKEVMTRERT